MRIAIGADHGGYSLKQELVTILMEKGHEVQDFGTDSTESVDFPDITTQVGKAIQDKAADRGILVCGSGVGVCIAANKMGGVYACVCHDTYSARQGVEHDGMNVLCLGGRVIGVELARLLVSEFLAAKFIGNEPGGDRFARRVGKVKRIEQKG